MKTLYESILSSTKTGRELVDGLKSVINFIDAAMPWILKHCSSLELYEDIFHSGLLFNCDKKVTQSTKKSLTKHIQETKIEIEADYNIEFELDYYSAAGVIDKRDKKFIALISLAAIDNENGIRLEVDKKELYEPVKEYVYDKYANKFKRK